jgi:KDO2-lipid IV(A) lauroyltransferase
MRRRLGVNLAHAASAPIDSRIVRSLVRQEMANEARRSADLLWAIARPADLLATLRVDGLDHVNAAVARGRGVLLAGIHVGGWEVAAAAPAALIPVPTTVIVADNWLAWAMHNARANAGLRILYRDQAALGATHLLRRGEAVLVLGDDAFGSAPRRHHVAFCDSAAWLPAGVVALSRITDAPIVPFEVLPEGPRRWRVQLGPLIEPPLRKAANEGERETLQLLADHWTAILRQYPQHWAARFSIGWDERT